LGFEFVSADIDRGEIDVAFHATESFTNPAGNVLGAFLAAMLYDTVGPALLATLTAEQFQSTIELHVKFHRPVRPGRILGHGRVVRRKRDTADLAGTLTTVHGDVLATATAAAKVIPMAAAATAV
jgi:uncharacterized protein (TIGR00369 family)